MSQITSIAFEGMPFTGKTSALKALLHNGFCRNYIPETIIDVTDGQSAQLNDYYKHLATLEQRLQGHDCLIDRSPLSTWVVDQVEQRRFFCSEYLSSIDAIIVFIGAQDHVSFPSMSCHSGPSPWMRKENIVKMKSLYEWVCQNGHFRQVPVYTFKSSLYTEDSLAKLIELIDTIRNKK
ncbi:hypothetical protein [Erwinia oleae]|uniref:hypothetical protein n=1 Tax=Erwinia oleae TaxID=796334 RepID=UPI00055217B0|nr:hypothetical protein [Erwinia oleae]